MLPILRRSSHWLPRCLVLLFGALPQPAPLAAQACHCPTTAPNPRQPTTSSTRINVNRADAQTLATLPGIGPNRAADIIALRTRLGRFRQLTTLLRVPGIGRKTFARLRAHLSLSDPPQDPALRTPQTTQAQQPLPSAQPLALPSPSPRRTQHAAEGAAATPHASPSTSPQTRRDAP